MAVSAPAAYDAAQTLEELLKELGLRASFRLASTFLLLPETYSVAQEVKQFIKTLGIKKAFNFASVLLLYSGPRRTIIDFLQIDASAKNHNRAKNLAQPTLYTLIDHTKIGKELDGYKGKGLYGFLEILLSGKTSNIQEQADFVMGFVSVAMILAASGPVETLVCGADPSKVFLTYELPALMANTRITSINGVPADVFRKIYYSGKPDAVYRTFQKICHSEVALIQQRMEAAKGDKREAAQNDRTAQIKFLVAEHRETRFEKKRAKKRVQLLTVLRGVIAGKTSPVAPMPRFAPA